MASAERNQTLVARRARAFVVRAFGDARVVHAGTIHRLQVSLGTLLLDALPAALRPHHLLLLCTLLCTQVNFSTTNRNFVRAISNFFFNLKVFIKE